MSSANKGAGKTKARLYLIGNYQLRKVLLFMFLFFWLTDDQHSLLTWLLGKTEKSGVRALVAANGLPLFYQGILSQNACLCLVDFRDVWKLMENNDSQFVHILLST